MQPRPTAIARSTASNKDNFMNKSLLSRILSHMKFLQLSATIRKDTRYNSSVPVTRSYPRSQRREAWCRRHPSRPRAPRESATRTPPRIRTRSIARGHLHQIIHSVIQLAIYLIYKKYPEHNCRFSYIWKVLVEKRMASKQRISNKYGSLTRNKFLMESVTTLK
jgi:hypothetical protein